VDLRTLLASLPPNPRVVVGGNHALSLVDSALDSYRLWMLNAQKGIPDRDGVCYETPFVGPGMRHHPDLCYVPCRLSMVPHLFTTTMPPDLVVLNTTPPENGKVSLGIEVNVLPAAIEAARARGGKVIAQANASLPHTLGDSEIDVDLIDLFIEADEPLPGAPTGALDELSLAIGELVAQRVGDVWTEMFSDSVLALEKAGALDTDTPIHASFLFGSEELNAWVDRNERVRMLRTEISNDPAVIARRPQMISINSALQVDLFGQANASRVHNRIHSGFGGQNDFMVGALHSDGGQAMIALRSWHPKADVSTVVPMIEDPVTSFQMSAIITEQGAAEVFGREQREQARNIIEQAAHPQVREELWEEAVELGLA
jgi:acyl-CoA hydrolase